MEVDAFTSITFIKMFMIDDVNGISCFHSQDVKSYGIIAGAMEYSLLPIPPRFRGNSSILMRYLHFPLWAMTT